MNYSKCVCGGTAEDPNPDCERCGLIERIRDLDRIIVQAIEVRNLQIRFFKHKDSSVVPQAKAAERRLDKMIRDAYPEDGSLKGLLFS